MSKRILIIEDEPVFRDILSEILIEAGYHVDRTPYLASAVGGALSGNYDLITLDLRLPEMDGMDIVGLFQRCRLETPVLVISGYANAAVASKLQGLGVRHIVAKPLGVTQLIQAVETALRN